MWADKDIEEGIQSLEEPSKIVFKWFSDNLMKSNANRCDFLACTSNKVNIRIDNFDMSNTKCEKLLGVQFDHKLTFDDHISELCKNASQKIHALARVTPYMNISKRYNLMNTFFTPQFSYCLLIRMCWSRISNREINCLHERCLWNIYQDKQSSFEQLLIRYNYVSIHQKSLWSLVTEM